MDSIVDELKINSCTTLFDDGTCRLCAKRSHQTVYVFDKEVETLDLVNAISQCLQIRVSKEDVLPKNVCLKCCEKLREFFEFYTLCSHSQESLIEIYTKSRESILQEPIHKTIPGIENVIEDDNIEHSTNNSLTKSSKRPCRRKLRKPLRIVSDVDVDIIEESNFPKVPPIVSSADSSCDVQLPATSAPTDNIDVDDSRVSCKKLFQNYVWECTVCVSNFTSLTALKLHYQETHKRSADFKCSKCGNIYSRYKSFVRHMKLHDDPKRFVCETCGKKFSQKTVLQSHQTVHTEERPHVCPQCGKAFKQFSSLYLHSRTHLPDQAKPKFHCSVCQKTFSSKHTMENHLKIHTGEKSYACEVCGKSFIAKGSLNYHMLSHDNAKNHSCSLCKKSFKTASLLAKHSTLHTGVKPHQCDVCGKQFRERSALKEHARIHTGEMPYVCEYCGKSFRFKGILTIHIRQHTGDRPYRCTTCCRSFTNWANLNKHVRRRHDCQAEPASPPSISLPSLDFSDPSDLPLSADVINIQDLVADTDIFRVPLTYGSFNNVTCYPHLPVIFPERT